MVKRCSLTFIGCSVVFWGIFVSFGHFWKLLGCSALFFDILWGSDAFLGVLFGYEQFWKVSVEYEVIYNLVGYSETFRGVLRHPIGSDTYSDILRCPKVFQCVRRSSRFWVVLNSSLTIRRVLWCPGLIEGFLIGYVRFVKVLRGFLTFRSTLRQSETFLWVLSVSEMFLNLLRHSLTF